MEAAGAIEVSEAGAWERARWLAPSSVARSRAVLTAIMAPRTTAAITPATATIRHTSAMARITITVLGKQSRNPGPPASTDPTDMAGGLGAIGKRELPETERRIAAGEIDNV